MTSFGIYGLLPSLMPSVADALIVDAYRDQIDHYQARGPRRGRTTHRPTAPTVTERRAQLERLRPQYEADQRAVQQAQQRRGR